MAPTGKRGSHEEDPIQRRANAMSTSVFQVGVDIENTQVLDTSGNCDLRKALRPACKRRVSGSPRANFFYLHDMFLVMDEQAEKACRVTFGSGELLRYPSPGWAPSSLV